MTSSKVAGTFFAQSGCMNCDKGSLSFVPPLAAVMVALKCPQSVTVDFDKLHSILVTVAFDPNLPRAEAAQIGRLGGRREIHRQDRVRRPAVWRRATLSCDPRAAAIG